MNLRKITNFFGINRVDTTEKLIALSYDDGPHPAYTRQIVNILERYQAKATFFVVGQNIEEYPEIVQMLIEKGNEIGNHSYSHLDMLLKANTFVWEEIEKTDELLHQLGVTETIHFRPPWGRRFIGICRSVYEMQKKIIMWDIDSQDYIDEHTSKIIADRVIESARPGAIVVMHDGGGDRSRTVIATEIIIDNLSKKGYTFCTVSELLSKEIK